MGTKHGVDGDTNHALDGGSWWAADRNRLEKAPSEQSTRADIKPPPPMYWDLKRDPTCQPLTAEQSSSSRTA